jgi:hypothetical protein
MNKKRLEIRWKRHHEKQEWQKESRGEVEEIKEESSQSNQQKFISRTVGFEQRDVCSK